MASDTFEVLWSLQYHFPLNKIYSTQIDFSDRGHPNFVKNLNGLNHVTIEIDESDFGKLDVFDFL